MAGIKKWKLDTIQDEQRKKQRIRGRNVGTPGNKKAAENEMRRNGKITPHFSKKEGNIRGVNSKGRGKINAVDIYQIKDNKQIKTYCVTEAV